MASQRVVQSTDELSPDVAELTRQIRAVVGAATLLTAEIDRTVSDLSVYVERRPRKWEGKP